MLSSALKEGAMDSIKLWARNGEAVRQAIELGEIAHIETASEELTDEFLLFGIDRPQVVHCACRKTGWSGWGASEGLARSEAHSAHRIPLRDACLGRGGEGCHHRRMRAL